MVKVLSRGGQNLAAVRRHVDYLSRGGRLEIETDGDRLRGKELQRKLVDDWDLDLEDRRRGSDLTIPNSRRAPKLVHKLLFSMPPGTPPNKVLAAVRDFAREEFALKHRYGMVLHTDEPHPHVHVMVKAVSEDGMRLHIRKATLRTWRQEFARHLREHGVEANATERVIRGKANKSKKDGIYRAALRGASTYMENRFADVMRCLAERCVPIEAGKAKLVDSRQSVERGWRVLAQSLERQGERQLSERVNGFVETMRPPRTERELLIEQLLERAKGRERAAASTR
jgi:hypothetical protein